jgi:hypothetical protein
MPGTPRTPAAPKHGISRFVRPSQSLRQAGPVSICQCLGLTFRSLFASRSAPLGVNKEHRRALRYRLARMCVFSAGSLGALGSVDPLLLYRSRLIAFWPGLRWRSVSRRTRVFPLFSSRAHVRRHIQSSSMDADAVQARCGRCLSSAYSVTCSRYGCAGRNSGSCRRRAIFTSCWRKNHDHLAISSFKTLEVLVMGRACMCEGCFDRTMRLIDADPLS